MSELGLRTPSASCQRLIDSIGPDCRSRLLAARDEAWRELCHLDEEQLETVAWKGRRVAGSLDEEGRA